ncbi:Single-stranded DNA binding protein [Methanolobus mangrovi]|uniref:Single-stranded DNA binding protein n=1 Tax=Methanolobus mangrovi TaxID=3072977 RepID=A0AA51UDN6_9EURY|nr:Single-stranded DNA binding protein [Methanolobus mangrovi]WMW21285.1 Single-stranded DNA binding protein [Methanolobus mangrovi]
MDEKIAPHIDELTMALGNISKEEISKELEKLLKYRVPLDEAKRILKSKYAAVSSNSVKVRDLSPGLNGIDIKGRIIDIVEKTVSIQGEKKTIFSGTLGDGTGICSFTCWDDMSLKSGDAISIRNAYTRLWNNRPELYFGKRCTISYLQDDELPDIEQMSHSNLKKLDEIVPADVLASSLVLIVEMYHREIMLKGEEVTVVEGVIADETAKLPFTAWVPLGTLDIGNYIRFEGAAVRIFRGLPSINFNETTSIEPVESTEDLPFTLESVNRSSSPLAIEQVLEKEGMFDVTVRGNIISIRPGSGLIERCPACNRVTQKSVCRSHGEVECLMDMRIKAILDDGTGAVHLMLNRELSEAIYGKSMYDAEKMAQISMASDSVFEDMRKVLTGKYLAARGNSSKNEFGVSLVARSVWAPENDLQERMDQLLEKIGNGCGE